MRPFILSLSVLFLTLCFLLTAQVTLTPAAGFASDQPFATNEIVSAFGIDLAVQTVIATDLPLPMELGGTSVVVTASAGAEHVAQLFIF